MNGGEAGMDGPEAPAASNLGGGKRDGKPIINFKGSTFTATNINIAVDHSHIHVEQRNTASVQAPVSPVAESPVPVIITNAVATESVQETHVSDQTPAPGLERRDGEEQKKEEGKVPGFCSLWYLNPLGEQEMT